MKAMTNAFKYANRYGYPDGDIVEEIAKHHGVKPENIILGAGSGEILDVVGTTFLQGGKKVSASNRPTARSISTRRASSRGDQAAAPARLHAGHPGDDQGRERALPARSGSCICATRTIRPASIVTKHEVKQLLDGIPKDMPVLIDEAYHHFVDDPGYATSMPYVLEGRPVIIARTFSKIAALAGMRLGYAIAPPRDHRRRCGRTHRQHQRAREVGGVAALKDTASQAEVKRSTIELRKKTIAELEALGYRRHSVGDELLHGAPQRPGAAGDRRVPQRRASWSDVRSRR